MHHFAFLRTPKLLQHKKKDEDDLGDSNVATRGDWWQGTRQSRKLM